MNGRVLILRPEPGASATAARAADLGLQPVVAQLFRIAPVSWEAPDPARFDALLLTSANAARCGGDRLSSFTHLPCYAVGGATADAVAEAGFQDIRTGPADGAALIALAQQEGARQLLHPCGRDHLPLALPGVSVERRVVYAAEAASELPDSAREALQDGALALIHSPRAAALFSGLVDRAEIERRGIAVAAISPAAAEAAGPGWKRISAAPAPRDEALLELAVKLCNIGACEMGKQA